MLKNKNSSINVEKLKIWDTANVTFANRGNKDDFSFCPSLVLCDFFLSVFSLFWHICLFSLFSLNITYNFLYKIFLQSTETS